MVWWIWFRIVNWTGERWFSVSSACEVITGNKWYHQWYLDQSLLHHCFVCCYLLLCVFLTIRDDVILNHIFHFTLHFWSSRWESTNIFSIFSYLGKQLLTFEGVCTLFAGITPWNWVTLVDSCYINDGVMVSVSARADWSCTADVYWSLSDAVSRTMFTLWTLITGATLTTDHACTPCQQ